MKTAVTQRLVLCARWLVVFSISLNAMAQVGWSQAAVRIKIEDRLPYAQKPIDYSGRETSNPVERWLRRKSDLSPKWTHDARSGYLKSVLQALQVPIESQLLVFSQTALNPRLVSPQRPRAIYFNDSVSVGWVPDASSLEIAAIDPSKGAVFYTVRQTESAEPQVMRESRCLTCHAGGLSFQVPGLMLRSLMTDRRGKPLEGFSNVSHEMPLRQRWGGWYVTGQHGKATHLGNIAGRESIQRWRIDPATFTNQQRLPPNVETGLYPSEHSDIVAHLVLDHQVRATNLMIRVGYEQRLGRQSDAEERLFRYLLFLDEWQWSEPVSGTSGYQRWFASHGPQTRRGQSLRSLDLQTRLFRHRFSYLIYSPLFAGLPPPVLNRLGRRWWEFLTDPRPQVQGRSLEERRAIVQILRETRADLPRAAFPQLWDTE